MCPALHVAWLLFVALVAQTGRSAPIRQRNDGEALARAAADCLLGFRPAEAAPLIDDLAALAAGDPRLALSCRSLRLWLACEQPFADSPAALGPELSATWTDAAPTFELAFAVGAWHRNRRGAFADGLPHADAAFTAALALADDDLRRAVTLENRGLIRTHQRRYLEATADLEAANCLFHGLGEPAAEARTMRRLAYVDYEAGEYRRSLDRLVEQRALLRRSPQGTDTLPDPELLWSEQMTAQGAIRLGDCSAAGSALGNALSVQNELLRHMGRRALADSYSVSLLRSALLIDMLYERYDRQVNDREEWFAMATAVIEQQQARILRSALRWNEAGGPIRVLARDLPRLPEDTAELRWFEAAGPDDDTPYYVILGRLGERRIFERLAPVEHLNAAIRAFLAAWMTPDSLAAAPQRYAAEAHDLLRALCGSATDWLCGDQPPSRVVILADGPVELVPFDALCRQDGPATSFGSIPYLVHTTTFLNVPSWEILALLPQPNSAPGAVALLDPLLFHSDGSQRPSLRFAAIEHAAILASHPQARILSRGHATLPSLVESCRVAEPMGWLHLGCHAVPEPTIDNGASLLVAMSAPNGNRLDALTTYPLNLTPGCRVILSACATSAADRWRGEGTMALWRAFLVTGASCVVSTRRDVDDRSVACWMANFHRLAADGRPLADALRDTSRSWLDGTGRPTYPRGSGVVDPNHPFLWAAYVCHGNDGGPLPH